MHERIRRHIGCGFSPGEWQLLALDHPVARLYQQGRPLKETGCCAT